MILIFLTIFQNIHSVLYMMKEILAYFSSHEKIDFQTTFLLNVSDNRKC